ncbi:L-glutamate gamma-semialdehyde dehydrogenase [Synoicihabitans lomoniglobus]|uniref:L-glutamate gamma-semialdehyde dehydrogenase n=1 Tax=Synoicihabitans lomoniglobus TaxID=2909285 RepID=A0AAE9ZVN2_9BACT|nr:L-glutamate gamma-semialdehyde dehydrogenase [Opitutaceae bacterium LMO-M01]WED63929.1 L-glutamate gamma-semialdehyde dehydrogenase [Opitutaceae bacterium LMO-M01]
MQNSNPSAAPANLEPVVHRIGRDLLERMAAHPAPGLLSKSGAYARLMAWSMKDPAFKAQLFRFVDVLPSLHSSAEIVRHLQEYLGDQAVMLNPALKAGLGAASFAPALVAKPVKAQVTDMARQFVAGETPTDLVKRLRDNARRGIATTIDLLGETVVSEAEADVFLQRNLEVLDIVSAALARESEPCAGDLGPVGPLPRLNLSVKMSALTPDVNPADPATSITSLKTRLRPILRRAIEVGAFINFDMESYKLKDLTFALFRSILEEDEFASQPAMGIALQAYLRSAEADLDALIAWVRERHRPITVRLVKGAYWDYETIIAQQRDWPIPVWSHKAESDASFERLTFTLLKNADLVTSAFASHNVRSCAHAIAQAEALGLDPRAYEFQALFGMADDLKAALAATGHRVREYCPVGELLPGMAYLVRRLLENTSNEGFLRTAASGEVSYDELLAAPHPPPFNIQNPKSQGFHNVPNTDFSLAPARAELAAALDRVRQKLGRDHPPVIAGKALKPAAWITSTNPAQPREVIGRWGRATPADADTAIAAAKTAFPAWRDTAPAARADILERTADLMVARRHDLSALIILEAGKPWPEADGDVSEAIDFCRFYAQEMRELARPRLSQIVPGERNTLQWIPRGIGVAIAPWNFPLAILCGLTVAPLVAGNCVIMKPAEQTTVIAATLFDLLVEAGLPSGVVNFLPGFGEDVGAHLVAHPDIAFIAFTGSRTVGTAIWETAGHAWPDQRHLKKVVCEMGGKNALIIDNDADLDEAIPAALYSAFGFSGQKCSALSRLIVLDAVYDTFVERFTAACPSLHVGNPADPGTIVGPVIDAEAKAKIEGLIATGRSEATLAFQGDSPAEGWFVPPTVFTDVKPDHAIAREEIFGPVVTIIRARDLDTAFAIANDTDYALTGGLFSRSPAALARAQREMEVGNLYLNRPITGAIVERQPFGGYRMSGGGTKAGGKGYLENFLNPRAISENVLRRGFTPPEPA